MAIAGLATRASRAHPLPIGAALDGAASLHLPARQVRLAPTARNCMQNVSPNIDQSRLAAACEQWLCENLHQFSVPWDDDSHAIMRHLQIYTELSLLAITGMEAKRVVFPRLETAIKGWLVKNPPVPEKLFEVVKEFPHSLVWAGSIWMNYTRCKLTVPGLTEGLKQVARSPSVMHFERPAGHEICVCNVLDALQVGYSLKRDPFSRTILVKGVEDQASDTVVYLFCHDIFFMSNWGARQIINRIPEPIQCIRQMKRWFDRCIKIGHVDLAAEIIIALSYLNERQNTEPLENLAAESIETTGLPQSPKSQGNGFIRSGDGADRIQFFRNYHTVIVCLMALIRSAQNRSSC
jgi:hypothetical protein